MYNDYKKGDFVICIDNAKCDHKGSGWEIGRVFIVNNITYSYQFRPVEDKIQILFDDYTGINFGGGGVYSDCVRLATKQEIIAYEIPELKEYVYGNKDV